MAYEKRYFPVKNQVYDKKNKEYLPIYRICELLNAHDKRAWEDFVNGGW